MLTAFDSPRSEMSRFTAPVTREKYRAFANFSSMRVFSEIPRTKNYQSMYSYKDTEINSVFDCN